ncbi:MAG TPA: cache domain-containing protein, partial [Rhodocyclaceae bacterium]
MTLLQRLRERFHGSLRFKLLAVALLPLVIALPLLIVLLAVWGNLYYDRLLIAKVRSDLAVAHGYFEQVKEGIGRRVEALAGSERLARTLRERPQAASVLLRDAQATLGVDFLILLDADGRVRAASGASATGLGYESPLALRPSGHAVTEVDLLGAGQLAAIDPRLAEKARTPLLKTQNALPTQQTEEPRGMAIQTLAPVPGGGLLVGGLLLNRNLDFVDRLNEIVYPEGALPLGSAGTATLFLDDVRIATNVRLFEGERAIGTRVSAVVRHAVLDQGRTWLDRAFVVNDWYVSAYEPIADGRGKRIGMLYVGYLEAPFLRVGYLALAATVLLFLAAAAAATYVSLRLARHVSRPVEQMHGVMSAIEAGAEEARVGRIVG